MRREAGGAPSDFQSDCIRLLKCELENLGSVLVDERIEGNQEKFFVANIRDTDLGVWIYKDGAEYTNLDDIDCRYERVDYPSLASLAHDFVGGLIAELESRASR